MDMEKCNRLIKKQCCPLCGAKMGGTPETNISLIPENEYFECDQCGFCLPVSLALKFSPSDPRVTAELLKWSYAHINMLRLRIEQGCRAEICLERIDREWKRI